MKHTVLTYLLMMATLSHVFPQSWNFQQKTGSLDQGPMDNLGVSVAISDTFMLAGAWFADGGGVNNSGAAYLYQRQPDGSWLEVQKLVSPNAKSLGYFGASVALTDSYALIGAYNEEVSGVLGAGAAYVYEFTANDTLLAKGRLIANDGEGGDRFGSSVAITDEYALIGAPRHDLDVNGQNFLDEAGATYLFEREPNGDWSQASKWVAPTRAEDNFFGQYLDIDGQGVVIGAFGADDLPLQFDVGTAYGARCGTNGTPCDLSALTISDLKEFFPADRGNFENFGWDVAISGEWAVVGKSGEPDQPGGTVGGNTGAAYFFRWENDTWVEKQKVYASDFDQNSYFGRAIGIDGSVCVIGAGTERKDANGGNSLVGAGAAYVFELQGNGQWQEVQKLAGTERSFNDLFGEAVDVSGTRIVVGAWSSDSVMGNAFNDGGSIYLYERDQALSRTSLPEMNGIRLLGHPSTDGILRLQEESLAAQPLELSLHTLSGKLLFQKEWPAARSYDANLTHLPAGMYLLQLSRSGYQSLTLRWLKP